MKLAKMVIHIQKMAIMYSQKYGNNLYTYRKILDVYNKWMFLKN